MRWLALLLEVEGRGRMRSIWEKFDLGCLVLDLDGGFLMWI